MGWLTGMLTRATIEVQRVVSATPSWLGELYMIPHPKKRFCGKKQALPDEEYHGLCIEWTKITTSAG